MIPENKEDPHPKIADRILLSRAKRGDFNDFP